MQVYGAFTNASVSAIKSSSPLKWEFESLWGSTKAQCFQTCAKARVCVIMSMRLVHVKRTCVDHWNIPNHHTSLFTYHK